MKVKHFFCKKTVGNVEFVILMGCVYIRENSFQLRLKAWLLLKKFIKMYYRTADISALLFTHEIKRVYYTMKELKMMLVKAAMPPLFTISHLSYNSISDQS